MICITVLANVHAAIHEIDLDTLGDVAGVYLGLAARLLGPLAPSDPHL